jgi:L-ribulose-5-phosphate 4-epimerase
MLDQLRHEVLEANLGLPANGLVTLTWGNVSGIDRDRGLVVIKPSGVAYSALAAEDLVVVDLEGKVVEGTRRPSTDTPTHLVLYRELEVLGGIVHTHSTWATAWAQAEMAIPILGTTHADLAPGPVPLARALSAEEVAGDYEEATGRAIVEAVLPLGVEATPCVLVPGHGPFCWGGSPAAALQAAVTLEVVAKMALLTTVLNPGAGPLSEATRDRHFFRKHGPGAYYGQH